MSLLIKRYILTQIDKFLDKNINLLILGSRQVGKTKLLELIKRELINRGRAKENQIISLDLESGNDLALVENSSPEHFVEGLYVRTGRQPSSPLFLFLDEIQYLPNPSPFLKIIADHFPQVRLFLSGSSSLEIKRIFSDRLTGRKITFQISTLNFAEYLTFQEHPLAPAWQKIDRPRLLNGDLSGLNRYSSLWPELMPIWEEFVLFGGYPKPSLKENRSIRAELLAEIRDQYVRRDVRDILNIENVPGFNLLLGLLAAQIGNLVNINELALSSRLNRQTLNKYLFLLQETFIIKLLLPHYQNPRQELIKMPKIYFWDTGLRNILLSQRVGDSLTLRPDKGALAENVLWHELNTYGYELKFWRTKTQAEVDFVLTLPDVGPIPIEVKYQSFNRPTIPSGLESFIKKYRPRHGLVMTRDFLGQTKYDKTLVCFAPLMLL